MRSHMTRATTHITPFQMNAKVVAAAWEGRAFADAVFVVLAAKSVKPQNFFFIWNRRGQWPTKWFIEVSESTTSAIAHTIPGQISNASQRIEIGVITRESRMYFACSSDTLLLLSDIIASRPIDRGFYRAALKLLQGSFETVAVAWAKREQKADESCEKAHEKKQRQSEPFSFRQRFPNSFSGRSSPLIPNKDSRIIFDRNRWRMSARKK